MSRKSTEVCLNCLVMSRTPLKALKKLIFRKKAIKFEKKINLKNSQLQKELLKKDLEFRQKHLNSSFQHQKISF